MPRKHNNKRLFTNLSLIAAIAVLAAVCLTIALLAGGHSAAESSAESYSESLSESSAPTESSVAESPVSQPSEQASSEPPAEESSEAEPSEPPREVYIIESGVLNSRSACLLEVSSHSIIAGYNAHERMAPASLTKIATAITVLEMADDLSELLSVSRETLDKMYIENASVSGLSAGEQVTVLDMLYALMLPSGGDAAITLAEFFAESEEGFAELMNAKAAELGLSDTHFVNTTGLDADGHYSTVADLAVLLDYAFDNEQFREIICSRTYMLPKSLKHPDGIALYNTAFSGFSRADLENKYMLGGKTGSTDAAGRCLAAYNRVGDAEYVTVTIGASGSSSDGEASLDNLTLLETVLPACAQ